VKLLRAILILCLSVFALSVQAQQQDDTTNGVSETLAQSVADGLRAAYGAPPSNLDTNEMDLSSTNYSDLQSYVGTGTNAAYGQSQQYVIDSLFAFGASMDNAAWASIKSLISGGIPLTNSVVGQAQSTPQVGFISGWIIVPTLVDAFATMDIYIQDFFGGIVYFIVFTALILTMGIAILKQMHEGKLDVVGWALKSVLAVIVIVNANLLCNYVLAAAIGVAAMINGTVIHSMVSQSGMASWYLNIYGPQLMQGVNAFIASGKEPDISRAFTTGYDTENLQAYMFQENGQSATSTLCEEMAGPDGYNQNGQGDGGMDQTGGVPIKELEGMYCLMVVYNVGYNNLQAHATLGDSNALTYQTNFQAAVARVYFGDPSITVSNTDQISSAVNALQVSGAGQYQYLAQRAQTDPSAQKVLSAYTEPGNITMPNIVSAVQAHNSNTSMWSTLKSGIAHIINMGKEVLNFGNFIIADIVHTIVSGILQAILMVGMLIWMILAICLCKMGVLLVVLTAPLIVLDSSSKIFWNAVKVMVYPSIYPAALIILMQLLGAMSSWIGTIAAQTPLGGLAIVFSGVPLVMGVVLVFMLPKIVKVALTGGNVVMGMMSGVKTAVMVAAAAATGGAALAAMGGKAAAGAAAKAGAGAAAGGGGGGGGGTGGGGGGTGGGGSIGAGGGPSGPVGRAMAGVGNAVNSVGHAFGSAGHAFGSTRVGQALQKATGARIPGTSGTVGKAAMAAAFGGIPGIALYAMKQRGNFAQQQRTSEQDAQQKAAKQAELDQMGNTMMESIRRQTISN
jgi:uncharacterized membrane protein YgcG